MKICHIEALKEMSNQITKEILKDIEFLLKINSVISNEEIKGLTIEKFNIKIHIKKQ